MQKQCKTCLEIKDISKFHKNHTGKDGYHNECGKCRSKKHFSKDRRTKEQLKDKKLRENYGISLVDYNNMFQEQFGCCAICKRHQSELTVSLSVDHCHITKRVRGLLCYNCNSGLGRFKDNEEYLKTAITYLLK